MRLHLFEFEDLAWFPDVIRKGMLDYLRYLFDTLNLYKPIGPILKEGLDVTSSEQIIDLGAGGGGNIQKVQTNLRKLTGSDVKIILTDKFPNKQAFRYLKQRTKGAIDYAEDSVDATNVPTNLKGFRVMFSAYHHFKPDAAKAILKNAVDNNAGIAIFDGGNKDLLVILGIIIIHPIVFFFLTPFFRPFRFSRLLFTYLIPLIPLCTVWDGIVSILRLYTPKDLYQFTQHLDAEHYTWRSGKVKNKLGMKIAYLIGYPTAQHIPAHEYNEQLATYIYP